MSKKYSLESSPLKMDLKIDLTMFCDNVKTNFEIIWNMFNKQSE